MLTLERGAKCPPGTPCLHPLLLTLMFNQIIPEISQVNWPDFVLVPPGQNSVCAVTAVHWLESLLLHTYKQLLLVHDIIYGTNNSQLLMKANYILLQ